MEKLIITLAPTGNVPTRELNPATPLTAEEIVADIADCAELGVSIAHIHARDEEAQPTHAPEYFHKILDGIRAKNLHVITQASTGARGGENTAGARSRMLDLKFEMASLATGSSNFPASVNANPPDLIEALAKKMYDNGIKPEIEAFDAGMISNAKRLLKNGVLKAPLHFNMVMNVPGSIEGTVKNLQFMVDMLPPHSTWTACGIGPAQVTIITAAIIMGGHVRTGLEDTLLYTKGKPATNRMLVERVVRLSREIGREIATPDEARAILSLKRKDYDIKD